MSQGANSIVTGRLVSLAGKSDRDSLIYGVRDSGRYVYHYTLAPTALKYILKNGTLLLNHITRTNDPREKKNWNFVGHGYTDGSFESDTRVAVDLELRRPVHLACFSADANELSGDHLEDVLKRGLARPRMWAQYGNHHKGFCLIFDREMLLAKAREQFTPSTIYAGRIAYKGCSGLPSLAPNAFRIEIPMLTTLGLREYCNRHRHHYAQQLFFEKLEDWRDEQEWRLALIADSEGPHYLRFENSLVGVVHGADMRSSRSRLAMHLTAAAATQHIFMTWNNNGPWYDLDHLLNREALMKNLHSAREPVA